MAVRGLSNLLSFYHPLQRLLIFCPLTLLFCFEVRSYLLSVCVCLFQVHSYAYLFVVHLHFLSVLRSIHTSCLFVFVCFRSTPISCLLVVHLHSLSVLRSIHTSCLCLSVSGPLQPLVRSLSTYTSCLFEVRSCLSYLLSVCVCFRSTPTFICLPFNYPSCLF